jgi:hypothetical protein
LAIALISIISLGAFGSSIQVNAHGLTNWQETVPENWPAMGNGQKWNKEDFNGFHDKMWDLMNEYGMESHMMGMGMWE